MFLLSCPFFRRFFLLLFLLPFQAIPPSLLPSYIDRGISLLHTRITESRFSRFYQVGWLVGWSVDCLHPFVRCSICRQTRLFRADHKGTMMSYFVNGRRVRLIESNLGRRSCFFVISHGASYTHPPLFPLSFYPFLFVWTERGLHSPLPLRLLECLFSFSFLRWRKIEEEGGEKVSGEACRFFFLFFRFLL